MKTLGVVVLACGFFAGAALSSANRTRAENEHAVSGELVVTNAATNQFRIVGSNGSFTAPAGTSVTALDGHTVMVELSSTGHVLQIVDTPVPINPVTHGWSTVRGQLRLTDATTGRFTFAGDDQTYVAPSTFDIAPYNGRFVEIKIDENGRVAEVHPIDSVVPPQPQSWNPPTSMGSCTYQGQAYSGGASVCQSGTQYRCDGSQWRNVGTACDLASNVPAPSPRSCMVGDATVANGSGICREGTTFRCDDGTWISLQTACR